MRCRVLCGAGLFFSSRSRHTRGISDWSSDVCSSDLSTDALVREALDRILAEGPAPAGLPRSLQDELTPEGWVRQFDAWVDSHDRTTPLFSDEAISRESIYPDRFSLCWVD